MTDDTQFLYGFKVGDTVEIRQGLARVRGTVDMIITMGAMRGKARVVVPGHGKSWFPIEELLLV